MSITPRPSNSRFDHILTRQRVQRVAIRRGEWKQSPRMRVGSSMRHASTVSMRKDCRGSISLIIASTSPVFASSYANPPAPVPTVHPPSGIDTSSIAVVEKYLKREYGSEEFRVDVEEIGVGAEILARSGVCYIWMFRDRLCLSVVFNEVFYGKYQVEGFVKSGKDVRGGNHRGKV
ncbi:hypothetical protein BDV96DRAFT_151057 [Lophiotrema nucula]|uniref:Uncharacterized protein n=1 Tax=Lophiotrema nucula TaxID=690887 RepID=A0A6A5Z0V9_9PLEO|nr:hypothetical protein BDV96DRAFT_151057 [Lophiotrema nucula]